MLDKFKKRYWPFVLLFLLLTYKSYALRMSRPSEFNLPWTQDQINDLNLIHEQLFLMQQGRYESDEVSTTKTNANNGEMWFFTNIVSLIQYKSYNDVYEVLAQPYNPSDRIDINDHGQISLSGGARVKKEFTLPLTDFNPGASGPTAATQGIFASYEFTIDDDMHTSFEVPTDCDTSADLTIEVYWGINEDYATNSGEVQWSATWRAIAVGENVTNGGSTGTLDFGDVNIPTNANTLVKTTANIAGSSISQDDLISLNGARVDLDSGSNPAAEPYIIMVNLEYYVNKLGESL